MSRGQPDTTLGRAIGAIWTAMGCSMFILLMSLGYGGHYDWHAAVATVGAMIGLTNLASAIILKWKMQFACAIVWLASAVIACFGSDAWYNCFSGGDLSLPDRVWRLRDDLRVAGA